MKVQIENILSIKKANIKINGLTVIGGLNDSGKSTIGKSIFCTVKAIAMSKGGYFYKNREKFIKVKLQDLKNLMKYLGKNKQNYDKLANKINILEKNINDLIKKTYSRIEREEKEYLNIIKNTKDFLFEKLKEEKKIILPIFIELENVTKDSFKSKFKNDVTKNILNYMFDKDYIKHNEINARILLEDKIVGKKNEVLINDSIKVSENGKIFFDATFIDSPVILQIYSILKDPEVYTKEYSPTIKDLVRKLLSEPKESIWNKDFSDELISKITDIINFNIKMVNGEIILYKKNDKFKLENVATGIKSFALLMLLIEKGYIAKNTILILDEPEVHLHPHWQLEYAKIIIELVKNSIKVLVATHSPYMLKMLEVLSEKYDIESNFYIPNKKNNGIIFEELEIGKLQSLYDLLEGPYEIIEEEARSFREVMENEDI